MLRRYEPYFFALGLIVACLPLLLVEYAPSGDGPEHILSTVILSHLKDAPAMHFEINSTAAPTQFLKYLLPIFTMGFEPPAALRWCMIVLLVFLALSIRFAAHADGQRTKLIFLVPFILADVSFIKGFLNFYMGIAFILLSYGMLVRKPSPSRLFAYGVFATGTLFCHPFAFALLGLIVAIELLRSANRKRARQIILASLPAIFCAITILFMLTANEQSGDIELQYLFDFRTKVSDFVKEGWVTISPWQKLAPMAVLSALALLWLRARPSVSTWPWITTALIGTYLVSPEGLRDWSWISIRLPLLILIFSMIELARLRVTSPKLVNVVISASLVLAFVGTIQSTRAFQALDDAISEYANAGQYVPQNEILTPIVPISYPAVGRVNVLTHANAYIAMARHTPYPGMFAVDRRVHSYLIKERSRAKLFGAQARLPWRSFVDPQERIRWFCDQADGTAISFDISKQQEEALHNCSKLVHRNARAVVWQRKNQ